MGLYGKVGLMLDAVIFDFDGVIVDSEPLHCRAFQRVLFPLGFSFTWEEYLEHYAGHDDRGAFLSMFHSAGIPLDRSRLAELIRLKAEAFQTEIAGGISPYPGALELIRETQRHYPIALCSGALRSDILPVLSVLGLDHAFPVLVSADEVTVSKPAPESYALALSRLKEHSPGRAIEPPRCLAIEDTPAGIASARGAGLRVLAVTNNFPASKLREADRIVSTLEGLDLAALSGMLRSAGAEGEP